MNQAESRLVFVDCEAQGPSPGTGRLTEIGAVGYSRLDLFHAVIPSASEEKAVFEDFAKWLEENVKGQPVFVSDNPAYDWQWVNDGFHRHLGKNPFGHSARRIGDFYAGLRGDFRKTQEWKKLRRTKHDHNALHDALGNAEAFQRILNGER
jgi:hypothetical protein